MVLATKMLKRSKSLDDIGSEWERGGFQELGLTKFQDIGGVLCIGLNVATLGVVNQVNTSMYFPFVFI